METGIASLEELRIRWDTSARALHIEMRPKYRQCFTVGLLREARTVFQWIDVQTEPEVIVIESSHPGAFNSGGDLGYFQGLAEAKDQEGLEEYGKLCIDLIHWLLTGGVRSLPTIAHVAGEALGGGFECALACSYILAERHSVFGFPEAFFGLFPGMGGFALMEAHAGTAEAEHAMKSGDTYTAERLRALGVVTWLAESGSGLHHLSEILRSENLKLGFNRAHPRGRKVPYERLKENVDRWTRACLSLSPRDIRKIRALQALQDRKWKTAS